MWVRCSKLGRHAWNANIVVCEHGIQDWEHELHVWNCRGIISSITITWDWDQAKCLVTSIDNKCTFSCFYIYFGIPHSSVLYEFDTSSNICSCTLGLIQLCFSKFKQTRSISSLDYWQIWYRLFSKSSLFCCQCSVTKVCCFSLSWLAFKSNSIPVIHTVPWPSMQNEVTFFTVNVTDRVLQ